MLSTRRRKTRRNHKRNTLILFIAAVMVLVICSVSAVNATEDNVHRYKYYTTVYVDRDATLWDISKKYVSAEYPDMRAYMDEVKSINHLMDDELQYGTTICVPYYSDEYK